MNALVVLLIVWALDASQGPPAMPEADWDALRRLIAEERAALTPTRRPLGRAQPTITMRATATPDLVSFMPIERRLIDLQGWFNVADGWKQLAQELEVERKTGHGRAEPAALATSPAGHVTLVGFACVLAVPPALALAVAEQESGFDPLALSEKGATGVLQVMPATARQYGLDESRLRELEYGSYAGLVVLGDLLKRFETEGEALAAYYAGPGYSRRTYPRQVVDEIARYVTEVQTRRQRYEHTPCGVEPAIVVAQPR